MPETTPQQRAIAAAQRQLDAYNAHDIDAFVACYTDDVELYNLMNGQIQGQGREQLRENYGALFERFPEVHAAVTNRSVVGNVAFDREVVTGRGGPPLHAMAIYDVNDDGLIARVWFIIDA